MGGKKRRREFSVLSFPFGHFVMTESVVDRGAIAALIPSPPRWSGLTATHTFVPLCGFYFFLLLSSFLFPFVFSFFPLTQKTRAVFPRGRIILLLPISVAGALCAFCAESIWAFFFAMFWACVLPLFFCHCPCSHAPLFRWLPQILESIFTRRSFFVYWRV